MLILIDASPALRALRIDSYSVLELLHFRAVKALLKDRLRLNLLKLGLEAL
jgi:hypothetical protein